MADVHQLQETFVIVVSQALGGSTSSTPPADPTTAPKSTMDLEARLTRTLG